MLCCNNWWHPLGTPVGWLIPLACFVSIIWFDQLWTMSRMRLLSLRQMQNLASSVTSLYFLWANDSSRSIAVLVAAAELRLRLHHPKKEIIFAILFLLCFSTLRNNFAQKGFVSLVYHLDIVPMILEYCKDSGAKSLLLLSRKLV